METTLKRLCLIFIFTETKKTGLLKLSQKSSTSASEGDKGHGSWNLLLNNEKVGMLQCYNVDMFLESYGVTARRSVLEVMTFTR